MPSQRANISVGEGLINWLLVPTLIASGTITVGRRVHVLCEAPAYHDHNWGHWQWGHDFAWQWGFGLSHHRKSPWSLVFDQMTDRARNRVWERGLALWKNGLLHRLFTQDQIQVNLVGHIVPTKPPKFPRVMGLVAPEYTADIPRKVEISAASKGDHLYCHFETEDITQIIIPNETNLGVTVINEVKGHLLLTGEIKGEPVQMSGAGVFEFLT